MPANTAKGYPYPLGTDRLMDGDDAIHALAQECNDRASIRLSGTAAVPVTALNSTANVAVTFPVGLFTAQPSVVVCSITSLPATNSCGTSTPTTGGVTIYGIRTAGSVAPLNVAWIAHQP